MRHEHDSEAAPDRELVASLIARCRAAADHIDASGMCVDVLGTAHLLRAAALELTMIEALEADRATAERLLREALAVPTKPKAARKK